jgi:hypothetical protein
MPEREKGLPDRISFFVRVWTLNPRGSTIIEEFSIGSQDRQAGILPTGCVPVVRDIRVMEYWIPKSLQMVKYYRDLV